MKGTIRKIFFNQSNNTLLQLFRYTFVGGLAFMIDFGLLFALTEYAGFHYLFSATISFVAGLIVNYLLSKVWVFTRSTIAKRELEFLIFAVIGIIGLLINNLFLWLLTNVIGLWYMFSKVLVTIITYLWNFFVRKLILFR